MSTKKGGILIISGISGAGKTTLVDRLIREYPDMYVRSRSTTTRAIRPGEKKIDYDFVTEDEFDRLVTKGDFLEHAEVHGKRYGTRFGPALAAIDEGKTVVLAIDVQGRSIIQDSDNPILSGINIISVFVNVDLNDARERLISRGDMNNTVIQYRMTRAIQEIARRNEFDYVIENPPGGLETTFQTLKDVLGLQ